MKKRIQFGCAFFVYAFKRFEGPLLEWCLGCGFHWVVIGLIRIRDKVYTLYIRYIYAIAIVYLANIHYFRETFLGIIYSY